MAKDTSDLMIVEDADLGVTLSPARKITGSDINPLDALTGEALFDDIDPRFGTAGLTADEPKKKQREIEVGDEDAEDLEEETEEEPEEEKEEKEEEEEEEEEEPADRKSSFQKRLAREKRLREESEANSRELKERLTVVEAKLSQQSSDEEFTRTQGEIDTKIAGVRTELAAAVEAGESDKQATLTDKLIELRADKKAGQMTHEAAKKMVAQQKTVASTVVARKSGQWIRKHPRFNRDPEFKDIAKVLDAQVAKDGFDPETDEYYEELDNRLKKRYPDEYRGVQHRNKPPSEGARNEGGGRKPVKKDGEFEIRGGAVRLTPRQVSVMRTFGLDPTSKEDVKDFISSNRATRKSQG